MQQVLVQAVMESLAQVVVLNINVINNLMDVCALKADAAA
jgi:hypothetical protein